jgi:hypothetical protein
MELSGSKYYQWRNRYGKVNEHNVLIPRDHWLERWEKDAIIDFTISSHWRATPAHLLLMLDRDIVAVSPRAPIGC